MRCKARDVVYCYAKGVPFGNPMLT